MERYEQYWHLDEKNWVRSDLKGKHWEYNLCRVCKKFDPNEEGISSCFTCSTVQYNCLRYNIVTPMWECPEFEENKEIESNFDYINNIPVKVKKLHKDAIIPKYQRRGDAGFDFHALIENKDGYIVVGPESQEIIRTGISCTIPIGYEIQVRPRSGLSYKHEITVTNSPGTVDSGYTIPNEIKVIIYNLSKKYFTIKNKDRIAQGVLNAVPTAIFEETKDEVDKDRNRGGGFGSTGTN
jgi:dUTP pyrophosphatase